MSERAAFIDAILNNPDDDTAWLVFADWLQEHGESERAEFVRVQIEVAKLPEAKRAKSKPGKRAEAILRKHEAAWRAAFGLQGHEGNYERGFLTDLGLWPNEFATKAAPILAREPAGIKLALRATLDDGEKPMPLKWVDEFAQNPLLRAVTKIASHGGDFGAKRFARLMKSPHLVNLRAIEIFEDTLGAEGIKAIADAPAAFTLESLDLNEALKYDSGRETKAAVDAVKVIAASPRFASLKFLGLMFNSLGDKSVQALLASKTLPKTMRLDLEDNEYDEERFAEELVERFAIEFDEEDFD